MVHTWYPVPAPVGCSAWGDRDEQMEEHSPIPTVTFFASQETFAPEFRSLSRLMLASIFPLLSRLAGKAVEEIRRVC